MVAKISTVGASPSSTRLGGLALARVVVAEPGKPEVVHELRGDAATIGRDDACAIVLSDDSVSRHHATFTNKAGEWWVRDEGSRNGVHVCRHRIRSESRLRHGDVIKLGNVHLEYWSARQTRVERYPFPVAFAAKRAESGPSARGQVVDLGLTLDLALRWLVALELSDLGRHGVPAGDVVAALRAASALSDQPLSTGTWLAVQLHLGTLVMDAGSPALASVARRLRSPKAGGTSFDQLFQIVQQRNDASHQIGVDDAAYAEESSVASRLLYGFLDAIDEVLAFRLVSGVRTLETIGPRRRQVTANVHEGPGEGFSAEQLELEPGEPPAPWCAAITPDGEVVSLAPMFAVRTSPTVRREVVFAARTLTLGAAGTPVRMTAISTSEASTLRLPEDPWIAALGHAVAIATGS